MDIIKFVPFHKKEKSLRNEFSVKSQRVPERGGS